MKKQKGITLIALIVTIIVLLILAGVSLNLVAGSNGILNRATNAVNATKQAQLEEELQLGLAEIMMDYYIEGNGKTLQEYIIEQCNKSGNNDMLEVGNGIFSTIDGELYYTDSNGNISMIQVTDKGEVSIEGSVSADGTVNDTNPPSIFATATTNSINLVLKDPLSGVAGWAYSATNAEPTMWNEVNGKPKNYSETIIGLTNGTIYYIWTKDANGNKSQVKEVRTRDFDELSYDVTWEGTIAAITVKTPTTGVQYLDTTGNWVDYTSPVTVESGTTVQFKVTDGNNEKTYEAVKPLKKSTITYHANGGSGDFTETAEHTTNTEVNFTSKPTRTNYEFVGWSQRADVGYADYFENGTNSFEMGTEDVTLYAIWKGTTKETLNSVNYGDKVNYSANEVNDWEVFLKEGDNVYLISSDYVPTSGMTITSDVAKVEESNYCVKGNSRDGLVNWLTNISNWSNYAAGFSEATAAGGPTKAQFCSSYNAKYGTSHSSGLGSSDGFNVTNNVAPYFITRTTNASGYWFGSAFSDYAGSVWLANSWNAITATAYIDTKPGVRPLVKLPANAKMTWNGNAWNLSS